MLLLDIGIITGLILGGLPIIGMLYESITDNDVKDIFKKKKK